MRRRDFLRKALAGSILTLAGGGCATTGDRSETSRSIAENLLSRIQVIDAHAHPDMDYAGMPWTDKSSTYRYMQSMGMAASSFAASGDRIFRNARLGNSAFSSTKTQIDWWLRGILGEGKVKLVRNSADIPPRSSETQPPGAILSIEGGDALEGKLQNIDEFHRMGVRIITLMHFHNNEIGDIMRPYPRMESAAGPYRGGLSDFGRDAIARMEEIGMVVDVAHASPATFREILATARKPVIDSHTNPGPIESDTARGRMRTWKEMELVARNGGVVCTWPYPYYEIQRLTILDWAKEIL